MGAHKEFWDEIANVKEFAMTMGLDPTKKLQADETGLLLDPHELRCITHALAVMVLDTPFPLGPQEYSMIQAAALAVHNAVCEDMRPKDDDVIYLPGPSDDSPYTPEEGEVDPWQLFSEN